MSELEDIWNSTPEKRHADEVNELKDRIATLKAERDALAAVLGQLGDWVRTYSGQSICLPDPPQPPSTEDASSILAARDRRVRNEALEEVARKANENARIDGNLAVTLSEIRAMKEQLK